MGLGLFLVPTIGGYWFLTHLNYTRYRAYRDSGYHVLFSSAFAGAWLFVLAQLIVLLLNRYYPQLGTFWESYFPAPYSDAVALSVILGMVLPLVGNLFYDPEQAARGTAKENSDLVELLMAESLIREELVELSLRNGKSYIGFALDSGIDRPQGEPDVSLIPMASGYRDKYTQELEITTYYAPVIDQSLEEQLFISNEDFRVVIPMSEIVSARLFFPEAYELFQEQEEMEVSEDTAEEDL